MHKIVSIILLFLLGFISTDNKRVIEEKAEGNHTNVIFILVDDAGWTDLGIYGSDLHETPNLDLFAQQGLRFTNAYTAASICSPVRASIMTGKHPARLNKTTWFEDSGKPKPNDQNKLLPPETNGNLSLTEFSLGKLFQQAGYFTAHIGKWHLGDNVHFPEAHGFDLNIGGNMWGMPYSYWFPFSGWRAIDNEYRYVPGLFKLEANNEGTYLTDRLTDEALKVIESKKDVPFFLNMSYYTPHVPLDGKQEYLEYFNEKINTDGIHKNAKYAAMISSMDENIGRILRKVDEVGIADHTVIIFYSDNGGLDSPRVNVNNNYPLRSGKGSNYEGGIRVPLIIKWPGLTTLGAVSDIPIISTDFYATFLDILDMQGNEEHNSELDGISLRPLLKDPSQNLDRNSLYWHHPHYYPGVSSPSSAIRKGNWKLIHFFDDDSIELYNLDEDIGESQNLSDKHPEKARELYQDLREWRSKVNAQLPRQNPDYRPVDW